MFVEDREKILKSAKVDSAKVGDWEMDCILGAKQIIDLIKTDPLRKSLWLSTTITDCNNQDR